MTSIEWTDRTWNPTRGCSRVSEGCRNCYAERQAARFSDPGQTFDGFVKRTDAGPRWTGKVALVPKKLDEPLRWKQPSRVFVNSMSDLFHELLSNVDIAIVFGVMLLAEQHTFQVLTKRPQRMRSWFEWIQGTPLYIGKDEETATALDSGPAHACLTLLGANTPAELVKGPLFTAVLAGGGKPAMDAPIRSRWPLPNVWLGVSVEDQATADERIPLLLDTPAAVRFVSAEPLLGPIDLTRLLVKDTGYNHPDLAETSFDALRGSGTYPSRMTGIPIQCEGPALDWVIVGGESGPGARACELSWIRSIINQCRDAGVACFVKQLGSRSCDIARPVSVTDEERRRWMDNGWCCVLTNDGECFTKHPRLRDAKGGEPSEWAENLRIRQFPALEVTA